MPAPGTSLESSTTAKQHGKAGLQVTERPVTTMARIVAAIGSEPGQNAKGLASRLGMTHPSVCRILRALDHAELITYENALGWWFLVRKAKIGQSDRGPPGVRPLLLNSRAFFPHVLTTLHQTSPRSTPIPSPPTTPRANAWTACDPLSRRGSSKPSKKPHDHPHPCPDVRPCV
jgi:hypothetical protein